jgi:hypothetical protein
MGIGAASQLADLVCQSLTIKDQNGKTTSTFRGNGDADIGGSLRVGGKDILGSIEALQTRMSAVESSQAGIEKQQLEQSRSLTALAGAQLKAAVRDYFLTSDPNQPPAGDGRVSPNAQKSLFISSQGTTHTINEPFGSEVVAVFWTLTSTWQGHLDAYELVKTEITPPNHFSIYGLRRSAPWGLWIRVYMIYK